MTGTWLIRTTFRNTGDVAYYGGGDLGTRALTPFRGSAYRFASENEALGVGYTLKEDRFLDDFEVEEVEEPTGWSGAQGTGGRAG